MRYWEGDPLSPFLSLLVSEVLNALIDNMQQMGYLMVLQWEKGEFMFPHFNLQMIPCCLCRYDDDMLKVPIQTIV